ncbi:hypothetical protein A4H97_31040 [Niastella yeongjuensis]|uniref:Secretion system C-terminal sorting domain-containing protein n=1 Tax=Niastella yeongjuensis TaxID=354355 RepID=A0A1V9ENY9_9BACT|nr:T9SS type A sorting domain-containing protein [Niastella yeongjuensis]OQP47801.1 hypothetical protein A4H97_31040 [Niastella yeongjuensis]SEP45185.1 Por secretion system C-terminal sorting domain-containing protein [Niastella yeongjuensis]
MKKFYLLILALVTYAATTNAQCPAGLYVQPYNYGTYTKLFVAFAPVGDNGTAILTVIDVFNKPIPSIRPPHNINTTLTADVTGTTTGGTFEYNFESIGKVQIEWFEGGVFKQCVVTNLPPPASLPIKLSSFTGRLSTETEATIAWSSSLEENSFRYEVERSADGKNFVKVGTVTAAGTSVQTVKYSFNDPLPGSGAYFYRLKLVDQDGRSEYSKTVYVNSKKGAGVVTKVFPNPFTSEIQLIGATSADLTTNNIKVFSITGQRVDYRIVGANAIAIDDNAPRGLYIIKIKDQTFKLSKQ